MVGDLDQQDHSLVWDPFHIHADCVAGIEGTGDWYQIKISQSTRCLINLCIIPLEGVIVLFTHKLCGISMLRENIFIMV